MSEKLIVKNFGPIELVELDLKKITVLTGEQSSGKSTLAKLVSIFRDVVFIFDHKNYKNYFSRLGIGSFFKPNTFIEYRASKITCIYEVGKFEILFDDTFGASVQENVTSIDKLNIQLDELKNSKLQFSEADLKLSSQLYSKIFDDNSSLDNEQQKRMVALLFANRIINEFQNEIKTSYYIPAERQFISSISGAAIGLMKSNIALPQVILNFGNQYEIARKNKSALRIDFLGIDYQHSDGSDFVVTSKGTKVKLSESASGYQAIIPSVLVIEDSLREKHDKAGTPPATFVIEEPELNLFPKAQKDFTYYLVKNCSCDNNELIITTHSPYILSSLNNLLLAGKLNAENADLKSELAEILPAESMIAPEDFTAYFLSNGGAKCIVNEKTGLIGQNDLDEISEEIGDEFDSLLDLMKIKK
jgi:predicted ATPase